MSNRGLGDIACLISLSAMFFFVGYFLLRVSITLRRRMLTIRELLVYVAGAGSAMALPNCFYIQSESHADMVFSWWEVSWFSLYLRLLSLALVAFLVHRNSGSKSRVFPSGVLRKRNA